MSISWHSFDFASGARGVQVTTSKSGQTGRVLGEVTTSELEVLCYDIERDPDAWLNMPTEAGAVPGWKAATDPGRTMLVALDDADERIVWGGMVVARQDTGSAWVKVNLATCEAYLDRRYVKDYSVTERSQVLIVKDLIAATGETNFELGTSTITRDRTYVDDDDKTVLSAVSELTEVIDGPEFTCELRWTDDTHTAVKRVWVIRDRIGAASAASFEMPGNIVGYSYLEDYSAENGANDVMATSSGEGDIRPESDHQVDIPAGWARFEHRFTPSTSITSKSVLNGHARRTLAAMKNGLEEMTFETRRDVAPVPGVDFYLGDDVQVVITSPRFPSRVDADGQTVAGLETRSRIVGYAQDFDEHRMVPVVREV